MRGSIIGLRMKTTENKKNESQTIPVATRITEPMHKAVQRVLQTNAHINTADYLRDLIRRDLTKRGFLNEGTK